MKTRVVCAAEHGLQSVAREAAAVLAAGGVVALPTDTVYGVAARADSDQAVLSLFAAKGRPESNPLPVLLSSVGELGTAARDVPAGARKLAGAFWPGPLTIALPRVPAVSDLVTAGRDTVGLRVPDHPVAVAILAACEFLVAVTSANLSGHAPARDAGEVLQQLDGRVDLVVDAGECPGGVPSTVVQFVVGEGLQILREGALDREQLEAALRSNDG